VMLSLAIRNGLRLGWRARGSVRPPPNSPSYTCSHFAVADDQYHEILGSSDAWLIADDEGDDKVPIDQDMKTTNSARRIKALVDQVTGMAFSFYFILYTDISRPLFSPSAFYSTHTVFLGCPTATFRKISCKDIIITRRVRDPLFGNNPRRTRCSCYWPWRWCFGRRKGGSKRTY
jgi:hypothetical protein